MKTAVLLLLMWGSCVQASLIVAAQADAGGPGQIKKCHLVFFLVIPLIHTFS